MVGEIHLARIDFTDGSAAKVRPVLLLKPNSFNDVLYLPLTSNLLTKGIHIDTNSLKEGNLPKTSVVVYEKPGVIATGLLLRKIGTLQNIIYEKIISELIAFLKS